MGQKISPEISKKFSQVGRLLFITGAGISVDSGLPTYRGVAGLYDDQNTEDGIPIEVALSGGMFASRPEVTWKYLMQIADACRGKSYNRGHQLIADLEQLVDEVWVLTQNIDGFHKDAGSSNVIEIHGTMRRLRCTQCSFRVATSEFESIASTSGYEVLPVCPECRSMIRPDVILFDEMLPEPAIAELGRQLDIGFDGIVVVGTSAVFAYISNPVYRAAEQGALTVEINPTRTELSGIVDWKLDVGATEGLAKLVEAF